MKQVKYLLTVCALGLTSLSAQAETDVTSLFLKNAGFDSGFNYDKNQTGNVSQEILPVDGWTMDISINYTITGIYEFGTKKTFNTSGRVPSAGLDGSAGCLALSTGWDQSLKYFQTVTLPAGSYKLLSAFYNGSQKTAGQSLVGWIPNSGTQVMSTVKSFPLNKWTEESLEINLSQDTEGKIQVGFLAAAGSSSNSAMVVLDYVKIIMTDDAAALTLTKSVFQPVIDEAMAAYGDGTGNEAAALKTAIEKAEATIASDADVPTLLTAKSELEAALVAYKDANISVDNPQDQTASIKNPSFEDGFNGWTQSGFQTQTNTSFANFKDGATYVEKWVGSGNVGDGYIQQTISRLPNGIYILKAAAHHIRQNSSTAQSGAVLFAGEAETKVTARAEYSVQFTHIDGDLTFGFRGVNATGNWLAADNFRLYYCAGGLQDFKQELADRVQKAEVLASQAMPATANALLREAIATARAAETEEDITSAAQTLKAAMDNATASVAAYADLQTAIATAEEAYNADGNAADVLQAAIDEAKALLANGEATVQQLIDGKADVDKAVFAFQIANGTGSAPTIKTGTIIAGSTMIFGRLTRSGAATTEMGLCWSKDNPEPTVLDERSTTFYTNNGNIYYADQMEPATVYYVRAYGITRTNAVGYGAVAKVVTLPEGKVTWSYDNAGDDATNIRIRDAVQDAVNVINSTTQIKNFHLNVHYVPGAGAGGGTADCSYGGYMRISQSTSYQRTGTVLHEGGHGMGVGTTNEWYNNSNYRSETSRGTWLGERVDRVIQFLENNSTAHLTGDNTHMWPYGINGAHEDSGARILYHANAMIHEALGEDGLIISGSNFCQPAYTFTHDDETKYYLKNASPDFGLQTSYLCQTAATRVRWEPMMSADVLNNDSCAWTLNYTPSTGYYTLKNVATGRLLVISGSSISTTTATGNVNTRLQLLGARSATSTGGYTFAGKAYWMVSPNNHFGLTATKNGAVSATAFNHANTATQQRWLILTAEEVQKFGERVGDKAVGIRTLPALSHSTGDLSIFGGVGSISITAVGNGQDVTVCTLDGRQLRQLYVQRDATATLRLPRGIYLVGGQKVTVR